MCVALRLFLKAVALDNNFSSAYGMAAWCYARRKLNGWADEGSSETVEAARLVERAVECGKDDANLAYSPSIAYANNGVRLESQNV